MKYHLLAVLFLFGCQTVNLEPQPNPCPPVEEPPPPVDECAVAPHLVNEQEPNNDVYDSDEFILNNQLFIVGELPRHDRDNFTIHTECEETFVFKIEICASDYVKVKFFEDAYLTVSDQECAEMPGCNTVLVSTDYASFDIEIRRHDNGANDKNSDGEVPVTDYSISILPIEYNMSLLTVE